MNPILNLIQVDEENKELLNQFSWRINGRGYVSAPDKTRRGHELIFHRIVMNAVDGQLVDHINRDKLDNRKSNLRITTQRVNQLNSGAIGIRWHHGKYEASVDRTYLGRFETYEEAKQVRDQKLAELIQLETPTPNDKPNTTNTTTKPIKSKTGIPIANPTTPTNHN